MLVQWSELDEVTREEQVAEVVTRKVPVVDLGVRRGFVVSQ